jgi:hypothetical protein
MQERLFTDYALALYYLSDYTYRGRKPQLAEVAGGWLLRWQV